MRALFVSAVAFMTMVAATSPTTDYDSLFINFKKQFNRQYTSIAEESFRRVVFEKNMRRAAQLQAQNPLATYGVNEYADVPAEAFKKTHHGANFTTLIANRKPITMTDVASSSGSKIDWVSKGAVTGVKNQKSCGGCWSFSTTGNIEGQWFLAGNPLVSLSEQDLLSCDTAQGGCHGGDMDSAFKWLVNSQNGNIDTEASYPFVAGDGINPSCSPSGRTVGATINGHNDLPQDEDKIADYVYANGPVSIGVDGSSFQSYTGGILTDCQDTQLDHAVLIVGFDDTYSTPYWIIKNSWGASWGESGYIRVQKGTNQCGLKTAASSSTVAKGVTTPPSGAPNPVTPSPNSPPSPPSPSGSFTQKVCSNSGCTEGCTSHTLPQDTCLSLSGGGSAKAKCSSSGLTMTEYPLSNDCSGFSVPSTQPVNQCVKDNSGSYLENICSSSLIVGGKAGANVHSTRSRQQ